ncbi:MAG TPA: 5'-3' exonuclease H3TH domain-containing protein [Solirubrobacteraceae bacterium]|nr:5'-3' exonuclease H3TH domain-containing protein [Solirubrobacteraceae bacterium]
MAEPLLLVDLPWLLYRSYFALPSSLKDARGRPTGALLGAIGALLTLTADGKETIAVRAIALCTGAEQAGYRVELYRPYHAHRPPMPDALAEQWRRAPELMSAFGWSVHDSVDLEADDVIFSLAREEAGHGGISLILSADRDLYGAVDGATGVLELKRGGSAPAVIDAAGVRERVGVDPAQVPDLIALRGDPSDGLPGARGIGAKTAAQLLAAHGSLDGVVAAARAGALRPRQAAAVLDDEAQLRDFLHVATLQRTAVERPADAATDFAAGARAARDAGMARLAQRAARLATA